MVASLGFAMIFGFSCGYLSAEKTTYDYLEAYSYPDACISTKILYKENSQNILALEGINGCDSRLFGDTIMQTREGKYFSSRIFCYTETERQKFYICSSVDIPDNKGVYLEHGFAEKNHIQPGDEVYFRIREKYRPYIVKGLVTRPETISTNVTEQSWGINYDFGFVYAPAEFLTEEYKRDYDEEKKNLDEKSRELTKEKEKTQKELNNAKKKLEEAFKELESKKQEFEDGKKKAITSKAEIKEKTDEAEKSVKQLEEQKKLLTDAIKEIENGKKELENVKQQLSEAKAGLEQIDKGLELLQMKKQGLERNEIKMFMDLLSVSNENVTVVRIKESMELLYAFVTTAKDYNFSYSETQSVPDFLNELKGYTRLAEADYTYLMSLRIQQIIDDDAKNSTLNHSANKFIIANILQRYKGREYTENDDITEDLTDIYQALAKMDYVIKEPKYTLAISLLEKLDHHYTVKDVTEALVGYGIIEEYFSDEISLGGSSANTVLQQYERTLSKTSDDIENLKTQRRQIIDKIEQAGFDSDNIETAFSELEQPTALEEFKTNLNKVNDGLQQLRDSLKEARNAEKEIDSKLSEAEKKLAEGENEYHGKKKEYENSLQEFNLKTADAEKKLSDAYKELENNKSYDEQCNQFLLYFDKNADTAELMNQVIEILGKDNVISDYTRSESPVEKMIVKTLEPTRTMMYFIPSVFSFILLVVLSLFMSMLIRLNRREIGILRAMGFSKGYIRTLFCTISLIVSVFAMLPGGIAGYFIMRWISRIFVSFYSIPYVIDCFEIGSIVAAAASTVTVCFLSTLLSTSYISKISPKEAMSRSSPPSPKIPQLLHFILTKASPIAKFNLLSILRNKGRAVFSVICIAASAMIIFCSFSFITSKNHSVNQTFFERMNYDCQIFVEKEKQDTLFNELYTLNCINKIEKALCFETEVLFRDKTEKITIHAVNPETNMAGIFDSHNQRLTVREGEIILERHLAQQLGISLGDKVTVGGTEFVYTQMSDQCSNRIQYISLSDAPKINDSPAYCLFCKLNDNSKQTLLSFLNDYEGYMYSIFTDTLYDSVTDIYKSYDIAAWLLVVFSMLMGFVIVMNTSLTNIQDVKKELCILRMLGFQHSEISKSRLGRLFLLLVCAGMTGIICGIFIAKYSFSLMSRPDEEFIFVSGISEISIAILPVLLYLLIAHFLTMRSMRKWNVTEIVKDKE